MAIEVLRVLVAIGVAAGAIWLIVAHRTTKPMPLIAGGWGLLLVASFVGYGTLASRAIGRRIDWGLRGAWGMSIVTLLGGALMTVRLARSTGLVTVAAIGLVLLLVDLSRAPGRRLAVAWTRVRATPGFYIGLAVLLVMCLLLLVGSQGNVGEWSHADDAPAYQVFPKQILQIGTLRQPFSFRRLTSYGGASLLQAMVFAGSSIESLHVFDRGMCALLLLGLVVGHPLTKRLLPRALVLLPALILLMLPNYRQNLGSVLSGSVLLVALYRTLGAIRVETKLRPAPWLLLGLVAAATVSLRPFYLVPAIGIVLTSQAFLLFRKGRDPSQDTRILKETSIFFAGMLLGLLPWIVMLWQDCGTPLFPLFKGTLRAGSAFVRGDAKYYHVVQLWEGSTLPGGIAMAPLVALAAICMRDRSPRRVMQALTVASFAGFGLLMATLPRTPGGHLERYAFPMQVAFVLGVASFVFTRATPSRARSAVALGLVMIALGVEYSQLRGSAHDMYLPIVESLKPKTLKTNVAERLDGGNKQYDALQAKLLPGAKIATVLDEPYRLDFARNRVVILDIPCEVSPRPGLPCDKVDAEALGRYLVGQRIRYLAMVKGESSKHLYLLSTWRWHAGSGSEMPQRYDAPFVVHFLESANALVAKRVHVYEDETIVAVDLTKSK